MRYYESKNGYKYKEYKNGKKVRISDKDYYKNVNKIGGSNKPLSNLPLNNQPSNNGNTTNTLQFIEANLPPEVLEILRQSIFWNNYIIPLFLAKKKHQGKEMKKNNNRLSIFLEPLKDVTLQQCYEWWFQLATNGCLDSSREIQQSTNNKPRDWIPSKDWYVIPTDERFQEILDLKSNKKNADCFKNLELHLLIVLVNQVIKILDNYIQYKNNKRQLYSKMSKENKNKYYKNTGNLPYRNKSVENRKINKGNRENVAYKEFKEFLDKIQVLCESRQYVKFKECALSHDDWYRKRIHRGYYNSTYLSSYQKYTDTYRDIIDNIYDLPILVMPMVYSHGYQNFLKQYVCGIFLYYSTTFEAHGNQVAHPIGHIMHNIGFHSKEYFEEFSKFPTFNHFNECMLYRLSIILQVYKDIKLCELLFDIVHEPDLKDIYLNHLMKQNLIMTNDNYQTIFDTFKDKLPLHLKLEDTFNTRVSITFNPLIIYYVLKEYIQHCKINNSKLNDLFKLLNIFKIINDEIELDDKLTLFKYQKIDTPENKLKKYLKNRGIAFNESNNQKTLQNKKNKYNSNKLKKKKLSVTINKGTSKEIFETSFTVQDLNNDNFLIRLDTELKKIYGPKCIFIYSGQKIELIQRKNTINKIKTKITKNELEIIGIIR